VASAVARLLPAADCASLLAAMLYRQVDSPVLRHVAETCVPASVAPTRLAPAHWPFAPAVQSELEDALLTPPGAAARAVPSVWVRHPVPPQLAVTSAMPSAANPPVPDWQAPAAAQVEVACPFTSAAPTAFDSEEVRVAHPAEVPLSQTALTWAVVVAKRCSAGTSEVVATVEDVALICAAHAVVPSQRVSPVAVLVLRRSAGPAATDTLPVS
jgi:hypothetical protein